MGEQNIDAGSEQTTNNDTNVGLQEAQDSGQAPEKLIPQSEVNKLVGSAKAAAFEKGKNTATVELSAQAALEKQQSEQSIGESNQDQNITLGRDEIRILINEEAEKQAQMQMAQQTVQSFANKLIAGKEKHQDFEEQVCKLDIPNMPPQIIHWANNLDNTADVMYEVAKNPTKYADVLTLSVTAPALAQDQLRRLSESIKKNEEAASNQTQAPAPLDQTKPSATGTDNGKMSVSDLRKQPWLKG